MATWFWYRDHCCFDFGNQRIPSATAAKRVFARRVEDEEEDLHGLFEWDRGGHSYLRDLKANLAELNSVKGIDVKALEVAFVKIAKRFGDIRGISYGAWRDAGVPPQVLKRAGVARTRS